MRRALILAACLAAGAAGAFDASPLLQFVTAQSFTPLTLGPVAWWKGDGTATDSASTNNGTWTNDAPAYVAGVNGQAFSMSGNNWIVIGNPVALQTTNDITLTAWAKASSFGNYRAIFSAGTLAVVKGWGLFDGAASSFFQTRDLMQVAEIQANHSGNTGWRHFACVRSSGVMSFYTNGVFVSSTAGYSVAPNVAISIGARRSDTDWAHTFVGAIDDVLFFDRALTQAEITQLYNWRQ